MWIRIITDITQRPVLVCAAPEASAAGAAALAREVRAGSPARRPAAAPRGVC